MIVAIFLCIAAQAVDGDTLRCRDVVRVRLARIDAPEMPGHCRAGRHCVPGDPYASRESLARLIADHEVSCTVVDASPDRGGFQATDRYGRPVAWCRADGRDLSQSQLEGGFAVKWPHD